MAIPEPDDGILRLELAATSARVHAPVTYWSAWSAVGWHRFGPARLITAWPDRDDHDRGGEAVDPGTLAALLAIEAAR